MKRTLLSAICCVLCGCYQKPAPPSDDQVKAVAETCKQHNMTVRVFQGWTTVISCEKAP